MMEVPIGGRKGKGVSFLVDERDVERVIKHSWCFSVTGKRGYLHATIDNKSVRIHRFILDAPKGKEVDHINGNPLDNRRSNLRLCNRYQNNQNASLRRDNTSGYKGVSWNKLRKRWVARIQVHGKRIGLGNFKQREMAVQAYKIASIKYHGEYSKLSY